MQSFTNTEPGVTAGCVGCHEKRVTTPSEGFRNTSLAVRHAPSIITPIADAPDIFDFPRDIQPILDKNCLSCHDWKTPQGGIVLSGDRGPIYSRSYFTLFAHDQVSDGRNLARSNYAPRTLGSGASALMRKLDGSHYGVTVTEHERKIVRLWIEVGAPYPGTYAALETGMIGGYRVNGPIRDDLAWTSTKLATDAIARRCASCHVGDTALPLTVSDDQNRQPWVYMGPGDPRKRYSNQLLYNLSRPDCSEMLLAPLAKQAGGWAICKKAGAPAEVFASSADPDYILILNAITEAKGRLDEIKRFDMAGFMPHPGWIREMKRYGILEESYKAGDPIDPYLIERKYWQSLWYKPIADSSDAKGGDSWNRPGGSM